jgi:pyrroline-5-carboxylate reductase
MDIVLIGAGNMGSAMLKGLSKYSVTVVEANDKKREELSKLYSSVEFSATIPNVNKKVVILAIKPQSLQYLKVTGEAEAVVSILAGTPIAKLKEKIEAKYYIRAMPNVAALNLKSVTSVVGDIEFKEQAMKILSTIGKAIWLNSEKELDIATGLGGSAPAWLAVVAEALADGAVNLGLPRDKSYEYLGALFEGVGSVLNDTHPAKFKDIVTSPGGTTAAGLYTLEEKAVRSAFIKAMESCYNRAKELS